MVTPVTSPPCLQDEAFCAEIPGVLGRITNITCHGEGPVGRYLSIQIPGEDDNIAMTICEVQVFGTGRG